MPSQSHYSWQVIARDYNAPFFKNYIFTSSFDLQARIFDIPAIILGVCSRQNQIEYIADLSTWRRAHDVLKERVITDWHVLERLIADTEEKGNKMNVWSQAAIVDANLSVASDEKLLELLKEFVFRQMTLYAYGTILAILDFADFSFVESRVVQALRANVADTEYAEYFRTLTYPSKNSFSQDQEEALLYLMQKFYNQDGWVDAVREGTFAAIKKQYPDFASALEDHASVYRWVYYAFMGPAFTAEQFFDFVKDYLVKGVHPTQKLDEMREEKEMVAGKKAQYMNSLQLTDAERGILNLASTIVWAKPRRKDYQSRSYYHLETLQREIGKRLALTLNQVRSSPVDMLADAFKNGEADIDTINRIYQFHVCIPDGKGGVQVLIGKEADAFYATVAREDDGGEYGDIHELRGTTACDGHAKGAVKIVNHPGDMPKMAYGDILVSIATTPPIVAAMKKAAAIVTDEGGLTCHAVIVSRELNIPCVIGTKIATKVLKDGDVVEVDAGRGVVRKI